MTLSRLPVLLTVWVIARAAPLLASVVLRVSAISVAFAGPTHAVPLKSIHAADWV